jgi:hypothetical protein
VFIRVFIVLGFYFLRLRPTKVEARVVVFGLTGATGEITSAVPKLPKASLLGPVSVVFVIPSIVHHS